VVELHAIYIQCSVVSGSDGNVEHFTRIILSIACMPLLCTRCKPASLSPLSNHFTAADILIGLEIQSRSNTEGFVDVLWMA